MREPFESRPQQRLTSTAEQPKGAKRAASAHLHNPMSQGGTHASPHQRQVETLDGSTGEAPRGPDGRRQTHVEAREGSHQHRDGERWPAAGRNMRTVWEIATQPFPDAHFATFPEELARRTILAGCPERVCTECGAPSERILERRAYGDWGRVSEYIAGQDQGLAGSQFYSQYQAARTVGWTDCGHDAYRTGVVLDPFMGSGTTALVARKLGRHAVGIELNPEYCDLAAQKRLAQQSLLA